MRPNFKILVVDDDPQILHSTVRLLKQQGYGIIEAQTGHQAIKHAKKHIPDLILLDNVLPDIDGFEVCRRLKNEKKTGDIFICILSGIKVSSQEQAEGMEIGADNYLVRPIENRELLARVGTMLRLIKSEKELKKHRDHLEELVEQRTTALQNELYKHKLTEQALKESEQKYRTLYENAAIGIFHSTLDGRFLNVNPALAKMLGYETPQEVVDSIYSIAEQIYVEPQLRDELIALSLAKGGTVKVENLYRRRDGSEWNACLYLRHVLDSNGQTIYLEGFFEDITERKQAEAALRESEEKYRLIVKNQTDLVVKVDLEGRFLFVSPSYCKLFGKTEEELIGNIFMPLLHEDDQDITARAMENLYRPPYKTYIEQRAMTKDGWRWIGWMDTSILDQNGKVTGIIGVGRDIDERKKAEIEKNILQRQLNQSRKFESLGNMAGGIAHEFNNMLGIIIGNTELALDDIQNGESAADYIQEIQNAGLRAKDVVRKLLSVAQKSSSTRKPLRIQKAVKQSLDLLRRTTPATIDFKLDLSCATEMIMGNQTEISQILINLCNNSVHAMKEATGVLKVKLESVKIDHQSAIYYVGLKPGDFAKLTVKDSGNGIKPDLIDRVFDPYFTTKDIDEGLGMGLAVVHGIVKNHDGVITIESEVGKGTSVEILFPLIEKQEMESPGKRNTPSSGIERILLVDDESSLVKMVTQMLKRSGYEVVGKTSSPEALKLFKESPERFDLVITDMAMPDMAGDRLAQEISRVRPNIPVMLYTGYSDNIDKNRAMELGINSFLRKPFQLTDLTKTVRELLDETKM